MKPPILHIEENRAGFAPLWFFLAFLASLAALALAVHWGVPLPECHWMKWTGIPCPSCGSTRSLIALLSLEFRSAAAFNPLAFLACIITLVVFLAWLIDRVHRTRLLLRLITVATRRGSWRVFLLLIFLNWMYVLYFLPKS